MFENRQIAVIGGKCRRFLNSSQCRDQLTTFDAKGAQRSVKMWTTNFYKKFFQKYFVVHDLSAVKNSFSTYV